MAYEKQGFEDRQTLTAEMMVKIEEAIIEIQETLAEVDGGDEVEY